MLDLFAIHELFEAWLMQASQRPLGALRRWLLARHLASCARCRSTALDLVEFAHEIPGEALSHEEAAELSASTKAALKSEIALARMKGTYVRRVEPAKPFFRPSTGLAMAAAALIVALIAFLTLPGRGGNERANASAKAPSALERDAGGQNLIPEPQLSPTAIPYRER